MGISRNKLIHEIGVPPRRINEIILLKRRITADTALRLAIYFSTTAQFWLGLQMEYDIETTGALLSDTLDQDIRTMTAAR